MLQGPEGVNGMRSNVVEGQEETIGFWTHGQCPRTPFVPYLSGKLCRRPVARVPPHRCRSGRAALPYTLHEKTAGSTSATATGTFNTLRVGWTAMNRHRSMRVMNDYKYLR